MINPFICYIVSFTIAIVLYLFGWSDLYPELEINTLLFLGSTILIHLFLSKYWHRNFKSIGVTITPSLNPYAVTLFIYVLWIIEFVYEGGVPLFKILLGIPYNYRLFGVPSLHVFIVTFSSFYTIYLFQLYLQRKEKAILIIYLINLLAAILIYSRAMLFFNIIGSIFIYLFERRTVSFKKIAFSAPLILLLFYLFGVLGNIRVSFEASKKYDSTIFLETGKATDQFLHSFIPNEFFWTYIYVSSPLANLQCNIHYQTPPKPSFSELFEFLNNELLPDFISKRVNTFLSTHRKSEYRINVPFNVSTIYSRSYSYLGWIGMIIMSVFILAIPFLYQFILPSNNQYAPTGLAILCTMYLFLVYDNTIRFTGLVFQLVYPFILYHMDHFILKRKPS